MTYCDADILCCYDCPDCEDPNWYGGNPYHSADTVVLHVVDSPPALYILQDSLYTVTEGQSAAYVPFTICNGDACADPTVYSYVISCTPIVGALCTGFPQSGNTSSVPGGGCEDIYGVIDAGAAYEYDKAAFVIVAWDQLTGSVYDTCVQIVEVREPKPVPIFTLPVVTVMILAMIVASAVIMKKRAAAGV